jgi:hypothetical protein
MNPTNFQLQNRILTILLHLCCSAVPPRLAHDFTFMCLARFCDFSAERCFCSGKQLYTAKPFRACNLFLSFFMKRISRMKSDSARADLSQKCCILLSGIQHLMQMLAIALASMNSSRTQPKQLWIISIQSCRAYNAHSRSVTILAHVAWPLLPFSAHTNARSFDHGMLDPLRRWCHRTFEFLDCF